jgi:DNA-binding transcriptional LysR family regulator
MKLAEINAFVAVAETGGMQAAAGRLHLTQSAVSRLVQRLEVELGARLFDRDSKPLGLTPDGERALLLCRRVLDEAESLREAFTPSAPPSGPLRLGIAHAVAFMLADPTLARLRTSFPAVTPRLSADWSVALIERVEGNLLDAAILAVADGRPEPPASRSRLLGTAEVAVVAARDAPLAPGAGMAELNAIGWVLHPEGCGYRRALTRALQAVGQAPNIVAETFGVDLQLALVARNAGLGLVPLALLQGQPGMEKLRAIEAPALRLRIAVWSVRGRRSGRLEPAIAAVEAAVLALLRSSMTERKQESSQNEFAA